MNIYQQYYLLPSQKPPDFANGSHVLLPACPMTRLAGLHLSCFKTLTFDECFNPGELPRNVLTPCVTFLLHEDPNKYLAEFNCLPLQKGTFLLLDCPFLQAAVFSHAKQS